MSENLPDILFNEYDILDKLSPYSDILDKLSNDYNILDNLSKDNNLLKKWSNNYDKAIGHTFNICQVDVLNIKTLTFVAICLNHTYIASQNTETFPLLK